MIIEKCYVKKFRGFENVDFELGSQLTIIAGQNGTQKTTVLGLLTQPFTITDASNPMKDEKPLSGGSFKSAFSEKFRLSEKFDLPKHHEWTLHLTGQDPFTIESIRRGSHAGVRFWRKGVKSKGSGYIQLPAIFLSLKRLIPIGEDEQLNVSPLQTLTAEEIKFFTDWHNKILIASDKITDAQYLESPNKNTLGINTELYDWPMNSAGQDNIGKILLAILSFSRLQTKYPNHYKGGILAIDELDATIYPGSQLQLIKALRSFASKFKLQIFITTHSLTLLEHTCELQEKNGEIVAARDQVRVVFLEKVNKKVQIQEKITYKSIIHKLNVTVEERKNYKIRTFTEDKECEAFTKCLLKSRASKLSFVKCTMGCSSLAELGTKKIPSFILPEAMVFVDGDVRGTPALMSKISKLPNFIPLPGNLPPEVLVANFLDALPDDDPVWEDIGGHFTKQYCFKDYNLADIQSDRIKAKAWFNSHIERWGKNGSKVFNPWIQKNQEVVQDFIAHFKIKYNRFAAELSLQLIP